MEQNLLPEATSAVKAARWLKPIKIQVGLQPLHVALADANGDGGIDLSDSVRVLSYLYLGTFPPPVFGKNCVEIADCSDACGD